MPLDKSFTEPRFPTAPPEPKPPPIEPVTDEPPPVIEDAPGPGLLIAIGLSLGGLAVSHWGLRTIYNTVWARPARWFARVIVGSKRRSLSLEQQLEHDIAAQFSQRFVLASPHVARWLHKQAAVVEQLSGVVVSSVEWTHDALRILTYTTVPKLIRTQTAPLFAAVRTLNKDVIKLDTQLTTFGKDTFTTVRSLPWGVTSADFNVSWRAFLGSYRTLWKKVWTNLETRVGKLETGVRRLDDRLQPIERWFFGVGAGTLSAIELRILKLEDTLGKIITDPTTWVLAALGLAAVPALTAGGMRTALQNLTCRNTQTAARQLCAMDEALLSELLAGTLLFSLLLDPREVARVAQETTSLIGGAWRTMDGL